MNWKQLTACSLEETLAWADEQPWCRAMAACLQDATWHAEGDVWTHTKLVCAQLPLLEEWPTLNSHERTVLLFTALLHDAGKPLTSQIDPESGRITSPNHAVKGEHLARNILRELNTPLATREELARMVRYHGRPAFLVHRSHPEREVISLSWKASNRLLYLFALADTRGRIKHEDSRPEDNLHLWKLLAEEQKCYERPYPFANDRARWLYLRGEQDDLYYVPHEAYRCTVTVMAGLPGSGKDTWLARHRPELPVVSLDRIRGDWNVHPTDNQGKVVQACQAECRLKLRSGTSFAFSATNLIRQTRQRWISLFANYDARVEIVYVEPPFAQILEQNRSRTEPVPERVIRDLAERCEPPTWAEGHSVLYVDGNEA